MTKKITEKRLENIALFYLQRYESCTSKLRETLKRRLRRAKMQGIEIPFEASQWVENIVHKMQDLGYIDDKRYMENIIRQLQNNGKSVRFICGKLKQDGIETSLIQSFFEQQQMSSDELDVHSAKRLVDKKKLGYHRPKELREQFYQKDLAILSRAGFSYEIACKVLKEQLD